MTQMAGNKGKRLHVSLLRFIVIRIQKNRKIMEVLKPNMEILEKKNSFDDTTGESKNEICQL